MRRMNSILFFLAGLVSISAIAGTNTLATRSTGQTIQATFFNEYKTALTANLVPRNLSGVATDEAGDVGTDSLRWRDAYYSRYIYVGTAAQQNRISYGTNQLKFDIGGVTKVSIGTSGLDAAGIQDGTLDFDAFASSNHPTIRSQTFTSSGTFNVPSYVSEVIVIGCGAGGGGGGGAGQAANAAGGSGGGGTNPQLVRYVVTPSGTVTVTIGTGESGGLGGNASTPGNNGNDGGTTSFGSLAFSGGPGGGGGGLGTPGAANAAGVTSNTWRTASGAGGAFANAGGAGGSSMYGSGGSAGSSSASHGGGGGGGAGGFSSGGSGGAGGAGSGGDGGNGNACAGGGGGGAASNVGGSVGGSAGTGGNGQVTVLWVGKP